MQLSNISRNKMIKTESQIEGIRKSCVLAAKALEFAGTLVKPGISTEEIDNQVREYIHKAGAVPAPLNYRGFPKSTCISLNEVVCHGIPNDKTILQDGDIIKIDIATILDGFFGDNCATFPVGEINDEAKGLITVTQACLDIGVKQVKPGNRIGRIGCEIGRYAMLRGYSVVQQFTGHGVGLAFHEPPHIYHICELESGPEMQEGMIFTIEPMINLGDSEVYIDQNDKWTVRTNDGKLSAQFEHTVLVTKNGVEVLTKI